MAREVPEWWGQPDAPNWSVTKGATSDESEPVDESGRPGKLVVHVQGSLLTAGTATMTVDGRDIELHYGRNEISLRPGKHKVEFVSRWVHLNQIMTDGEASTHVTVQPEQTVELYYAGSFGGRGKVGPTKQKRPDVVILGVLMGALALIVVFCVVYLSYAA